MSEDVAQKILLLFILLVGSAFFSGSETAVTTIGRGKLLALQERHPRRRKSIEWLLEDMQRALTVILIGNNLVNIAASAVATSVALALIGSEGVLVAVAFMTVVIVIFGEILPKSVAIVKYEPFVIAALPVLRIIHVFAKPLILATTGVVHFFGALFRVDLSARHTFVTREEIEQMVDIGEASGAIEEDERRMIHGIISFEETRVYEIMIPRTDMIAISSETTLEEAVAVFQECGHSRVPVFERSPDHIVGILYVKDIIGAIRLGKFDENISGLKREALFVPEMMRIADLLDIMKGKRVHMAIVVDEYGGTAGLVTLEDLIEEIVGEIQDEYDEETPPLQKEAEGSYLVKGYMDLEDLSEEIGYPFVSADVDTIGGLILSLAGRFPDQGQRLYYGNWDIEVLEVEDHRIKLIRLSPKDAGVGMGARETRDKDF